MPVQLLCLSLLNCELNIMMNFQGISVNTLNEDYPLILLYNWVNFQMIMKQNVNLALQKIANLRLIRLESLSLIYLDKSSTHTSGVCVSPVMTCLHKQLL